MKKIILIALLTGVSNLFAQQPQDSILVKEIPTIKNNVFQQRQEIDALTKKLSNQNYKIGKQSKTISALQDKNKSLNTSIDSLSQLIQTNSQNIVTNSKELGTKIQETGQKADTQIAKLDNSVEKNRLYWIIATLGTLLLGGLVYWLIGKRIASSKTDVETKILSTKTELIDKSNAQDAKLVEIDLSILKGFEEIIALLKGDGGENDHSLVLKVADRLTAMETNHYRMDPSTKGLKSLIRAVKSIKENYLANGYEIVEMIGQEYKEGLNVTANFIPSEDIETGKQIITMVIKPQVNYKGKMIQAAEIQVSVGE